MASHAIHIEGVTRRFGDTLAVDDLSLSVDVGEVFGFLGHNGAGKTTTVRLLNGVLAADSGQLHVLGLDPQTQGPQLRARTGVLTETPSLDERLTAIDNLTIYADLYGVAVQQVKQRVSTMLETFGLSERAQEKVGGYSKGMKQRLALARAVPQDLAQLALEAHLEQSVRLVHHKDAQVVKMHRHGVAQVIQKAPRCGHNDVGRLAQRSLLHLEAQPSNLFLRSFSQLRQVFLFPIGSPSSVSDCVS